MATAAKVHTSVHEYLQSHYETDCDLVDGELQERNLGEYDHAFMQMAIGIWFFQHFDAWRLHTLAEMRIQTSLGRYRVADIAVVPSTRPRERILTTPPLLVIEILSPEDRISRYEERIADYRQMGIQTIWVVDPGRRILYECSSGDWLHTSRLEIPGSPVYLTLDELPFAGDPQP